MINYSFVMRRVNTSLLLLLLCECEFLALVVFG